NYLFRNTQCSDGICVGDIVYVSTPASGNGSVWTGPIRLPGQRGAGAPAVACENSAFDRNCEVIVTGTDPNRLLWTFGFGLNTDGSLWSSSGGSASGAHTNMPISITFNGQNLNGKFVAAHQGVDGSGIFLSQKTRAGDPWGPWVLVPNTSRSMI